MTAEVVASIIFAPMMARAAIPGQEECVGEALGVLMAVASSSPGGTGAGRAPKDRRDAL
jgi:hypothetical protein